MQLYKKIIFLGLSVLNFSVLIAQELKSDSSVIVSGNYPGSIQVRGSVRDAATGKPLGGIRVTYKNYSAAITDSGGSFRIPVPDKNVSILLEGEGFQTKEIALKGRTELRAELFEDTYTSFYDQAMLPLKQEYKSHIPYAASSVQTNGNWGRITESPATYLQGKVAGLQIIRRSGTPNTGAFTMLRGISSLYASNQPLIVVDGIIFDNRDLDGSIISGHHTDPLSTIDVRDIDNITVIKDGSSTYGTKGANGVILITTARAKELGTKIDFSIYGGINFKPENLPVLGATDYRVYISEILQSKGLTDTEIQALPYMNDDKNNADYFRYHNNTNWQDQVFKTSFTKNIYLKVTGGDNIAKYALSLGYMGSDAIVRNTDFTRYNMRFNGDLNLSRRVSAVTNLSFGFNEQSLRDQGVSTKTNPIFLALVKSPLLRVQEVSDKGIESPTLADRDTFNVSNPLSLTNLAVGVNKNYRFLGSISFNYKISKAINLSTTVGVTNNKVRENFFIPRKGVTTDTLATDIAYSRLGSGVKSLFSLFNDSRISYNKKFSLHELSVRLGMRYLYSKGESDFEYSANSPIDELVSVGNGTNSLRRVDGSLEEYNWLNTYFNADYVFSDKYFLSLNAAMDGSSRFGKDIDGAFRFNGNNYAVLPSVAAAWLVSSENIMRNSAFDLLKIRASIGLTGNDDVGKYSWRQIYIPQNFLGLQGLVRGGFANDQLQWEKMRKVNFGLDASFMNERISFSADAFFNRTDKMLAFENAPVASGFSYVITNSGALSTKGIEAAVNARIINHASFKWDVGATIGKYRSEIEKLPGDKFETSFSGATYITQTGSSPNLFYGFRSNGVYVSDVEATQSGISVKKADGSLVAVKGGDVRFTDLNNDKIIDDNDRAVIGDPNPDFFGSFTNKLEYRNFSLDALFSFVQGNDIYNYTRSQLESMSGYYNQTEAVLNRWKNNGHVTNMPKATWGDPMGNARFSDRWIEDGSYLRLRTITLSYNVPIKPGFFKYGVVYLTGNNLFTMTHYKGYDPEFSAGESLFAQGVDNTLEPQFRSIQMGLRIGL